VHQVGNIYIVNGSSMYFLNSDACQPT